MPKLKVVSRAGQSTYPKPPPNLGSTGQDLWNRIIEAYSFDEPASLETLFQACAAADRAAELAERIDSDGLMVETRSSVRDNPLLKAEIAARSFVVRTLARLGLDLEPVRPGRGRPPGYRL